MGDVLVALWFPGGKYKGIHHPEVTGLLSGDIDVGHACVNIDGLHVSLWPAEQIAPQSLTRDVGGEFYKSLEDDLYAMGKVDGEVREYDDCYVIRGLDTDAMKRDAELEMKTPRYHALSRNCSTVVARLLLAGFGRYKARMGIKDKAMYAGTLATIGTFTLGIEGAGVYFWTPECVMMLTRAVLTVTGGQVEKGSPMTGKQGIRSKMGKVRPKIGWN